MSARTLEKIAPSVMIDGQTVTPPGWAWVLAFALRGVPWAVEEALKPEFDKMVKNHFLNYEIKDLERQVEEQLAQIRWLKERLQ